MKKIILIFLIYLIFYSCQKEESKSDFIGNWSATSDTNFDINITFSNDSILIENPVVHYDRNYSTKWKVYGQKIKLEETVWDFKLNSRKDTLFIKHDTDSVYHLSLKRIRNNFEFLENRIGLKLNLPKTSEKLTHIENQEFGFNIFLGKENDSLIIKTVEYTQNFDKLKYQIIQFYYSKKEENTDNLKYILFADKSVNNKELDSVKTILKELPIKKFFRIYNNDKYLESDWKTEINWFGKYEN